MEHPHQRWLGSPQSKGRKSKLWTGARLAEICILTVLDLLIQYTAFEKGEKNGFLAPLVTSINFFAKFKMRSVAAYLQRFRIGKDLWIP